MDLDANPIKAMTAQILLDQTTDRGDQLVSRKICHVEVYHFVPRSMKLTVRELKVTFPILPAAIARLAAIWPARTPWAYISLHTERSI